MTKSYIDIESVHQAAIIELAETKEENDKLAKNLRKLISEARQALARGRFLTSEGAEALLNRIESAEQTLDQFSKVRGKSA